MKWIVVNSLPLMSSEDPFFKVPSQSTKLYLYFSFSQLYLKFGSKTLLSHATLLAKVPYANSLGIGKFVFSSPFNEFVNNSIDVWNEDVLYNWMDRDSMSISKPVNPLRLQRKCILLLFLINVYSKIGPFVANLFASTCMCSSSKNSFTVFASKKLSNHLSPCR
jgi:hypothetical protein